jgi:hypothetical protein
MKFNFKLLAPPEKSSREVEESAQSHLAMMSLRLGPQNCIVSNWMMHPCMAPCNRRGIKWKYRTVIVSFITFFTLIY